MARRWLWQAAMLAHVRSAAVVGVEASAIEVEVDVANGLPGCHIVGLPDAGVKEGRIRIRGASSLSLNDQPLRRPVCVRDLGCPAGRIGCRGIAFPATSCKEQHR